LVTVSVVLPLIMPEVAVMVVVPAPTAVAKPLCAGSFATLATVGSDELHCAMAVMFCVLLSLKVPVAVNCC
jgi:uncharacterized protein (DUF2062 family)